MLTLLLTVALSLVTVLALHEAGHAIAALALGGRQVRLIGRPWGAAVEALLPVTAGAQLTFVLAGPLASACAGAALACAGGVLLIPGALSAAFALLCLIPYGRSDGARALSIVRSRG